MTFLITGSSGYIGSRLGTILADKGHTVFGVDRVSSSSAHSFLDRFTHGDLCDPAVAKKAVEGVDSILHLAAAKGDWGISEREYFQDNLDATEVLLDVGKENGIASWVFYSTVSVMGPSEKPISEDAGFAPINPYGASKAKAEQLFISYAETHPEAKVLVIRPSVVYGPGNPESTNIYRLIDTIYKRRFVMVGPGEAVKTTSYITNLLAATTFLMERTQPGLQTFTYVDRPKMTTGEIVEHIYQTLGKTPPSWHVPLAVAEPIAKISDTAARLTKIDFPITAARIKKFNRSTNFRAEAIRTLGFKQPVDNKTALNKTIDWHIRTVYDRPR